MVHSLVGDNKLMEKKDEQQLDIHMSPEMLAGCFANFASINHDDYGFTLTFVRLDHGVDDKSTPGVVVARVNAAPKFVKEMLTALNDNYEKWEARESIRNLPEAPESDDPQDSEKPE